MTLRWPVTTTEAPARADLRRITVRLTPPHSAWQRELIETPLSAVVLAGGRAGKTEAAIRRTCRAMIREPGLYFWVGLSWQSASMEKAWRVMRLTWGDALRRAGLDVKRHINLSKHEIALPNGSLLMFRSSEAPSSIAGDGPRGIVGDEFTYWPEDVYTRFVMPSTADHGAWVHLIGRPHGENWGSALWRRAATRPGWISRQYTIYDNPLLDRAFIEDLRENTPDPIWRQEYMAEPGSGDDGMIPLEYVIAAQQRWREREAAGTLEDGPYFLAIDVSEGGGDLTTFAHRYGWTIARLTDETPRVRGDMMPIADKAIILLGSRPGSFAVVDAVGVGAMLPGAIRRAGGRCLGFKGSKGTKLRDRTGQFGFSNLVSAAWWHARELLGPNGPGVALPPDPRLAEELTTPRYEVMAGAVIAREQKTKLVKRLGRSPDRADAVVMSLWDRTVMR